MGKRELNIPNYFTLKKNEFNVLGIVLFAVAIVKVVGVLFILHFLKMEPGSAYYDELINNLLSGNGYTRFPEYLPELVMSPLYPFIGAGLMLLFGNGFLPVIVAQVIIDLLTCIVIFFTGRMLFNFKVGILSAIMVGLYPLSIVYSSRIMTETLLTFLISLILLIFLLIWRTPLSKALYIIAGIMLGIASLCKPYIMAFIFFLGGGIWLKEKLTVKIFIRLCFMIFAMIAVISPWTIRNFIVTGDLVPVSTGMGYTIWVGNRVMSEGREGQELVGKDLAAYEEARARIVSENGGVGKVFFSTELNRKFLGKAIDNFAKQPLSSLRLMFGKPVRLWYEIFHQSNKKYQWIVSFIQIPLVLMGFIGIAMSIYKGYNGVVLFLLLLIYHILIAFVFVATVRYIVPIMPQIIMFAIYWAVGREGNKDAYTAQ